MSNNVVDAVIKSMDECKKVFDGFKKLNPEWQEFLVRVLTGTKKEIKKEKKYVWIEVINGEIYTNISNKDYIKKHHPKSNIFTKDSLDMECNTGCKRVAIIEIPED